MPGDRRPTLPRPVLCLVTDRTLVSGTDALALAVDRAVSGGVNMVQLREKDLDAAALLDLAKRLREVTLGRALLIVNGNPQVAIASQADGVQLAEGAMTVAEARGVTGRRALVGRSVHSLEGAARAQRDGAGFLILGAIFRSHTHPGGQLLGVRGLRQVAQAVQVPVVAIGGIGPANARGVMAAGAAGVAVISAILGSSDPATAAKDLLSALMQPRGPDQTRAREE